MTQENKWCLGGILYAEPTSSKYASEPRANESGRVAHGHA